MRVKRCSRCRQEKSRKEFSKCRTRKDGYHNWCKACFKQYRQKNRKRILKYNKQYYQKNKKRLCEYSKQWWQKNKKRYRLSRRKYALNYYYNLTPEEYDTMFAEQRGCCGICNRHQSKLKRKLDVDHNPKINKVRGLLCRNCNIGLGYFFHNTEYLKQAIKYLRRHK